MKDCVRYAACGMIHMTFLYWLDSQCMCHHSLSYPPSLSRHNGYCGW